MRITFDVQLVDCDFHHLNIRELVKICRKWRQRIRRAEFHLANLPPIEVVLITIVTFLVVFLFMIVIGNIQICCYGNGNSVSSWWTVLHVFLSSLFLQFFANQAFEMLITSPWKPYNKRCFLVRSNLLDGNPDLNGEKKKKEKFTVRGNNDAHSAGPSFYYGCCGNQGTASLTSNQWSSAKWTQQPYRWKLFMFLLRIY